jgi:hypothetical protein
MRASATPHVLSIKSGISLLHNSLTTHNLKPKKATSKTRSGFFDENTEGHPSPKNHPKTHPIK